MVRASSFVTLAVTAAALTAFYGAGVPTRTGTSADGGRYGLELIAHGLMEEAFSLLADVALDGDGVVEMALMQLTSVENLPIECVQPVRGSFLPHF